VTDLDTVRLSGAGRIQAKLATHDFFVNLSGAGSIEICGSATHQVVNLSGAGSYQAQDLACHTARVTVSGKGYASIWVLESLVAAVSGEGVIDYYGHPAVTSKVSDVGAINDKGDK